MGKKGKVGKQRKDNYYKLAKQKGFRSRAAFKLIQLNRKFQFLENSRVCVDLCAAPGGWLQVASEYMPVSSVIVGVDLVPITPIRNVITFQSDITTKECSDQIENTLANWKADIVLHDGAPNVGKNWLHDAYGQNVLVVSALKLACRHLTKGGWFVTKIFRSADYNSLLWVFGKLFGKVHATKPQASRQESAEIFVVCQNYKQPSDIDPKFFDPSALFADISQFDETLKKQKADLLKPANKIKKAKAIGYEDMGDVLKTCTDLEFVATSSHMDYLAQCAEIKINNSDILAHESTTDEIKECCKDLKLLGKKDLLKLLKWRRTLRKDLTAKLMKLIKEKSHTGSDGEEADQDEDDDNLDQMTIRSDDDDDDEAEPELQLDDIEAQMDQDKRRERKRLKKKEEKRVKDYQQRVSYGMINQGDVLIEEEHDLFSLKSISGEKQLDAIDDANPDEVLNEAQDPDDNAAEAERQKKRVSFSRETDVKYFELDEHYNEDDEAHPSDDIVPEKHIEAKLAAPTTILKDNQGGGRVLNRLGKGSNLGGGLLVDLMDVNQSKVAAASKFFDRNSLDVDLEKEFENDLVEKIATKSTSNDSETVVSGKRKLSDTDMSRFDASSSEDEYEAEEDEEDDGGDKRKIVKLDAGGLALATMMVGSKKARTDIEDEGWNRYSHGDTHMAPKWFRDEEAKHYRRNIPVNQEMVKEYKQKLRDIDAKPIKKAMQAKVRQKRRAMKKMDRVKKKVDAITSNDDTTQREKINQIKSVYKNATKSKKPEIKVVVARKGLPTKRPGKGKYKVVDSRLKKDLRAKKRRETKGKNGGKGGKGKGNQSKRSGPKRTRRSNNTMDGKSYGKSKSKVKSKKGGAKSRRK